MIFDTTNTRLVGIKELTAYNEEWAEKLESAIQQNIDSFGEKQKNYTKDNLELDKHLCYHVLVSSQSNEIIAGCGVFNGGRYPSGVYRVLNRAFILPQFRQKDKPSGLLAKMILPKQIQKIAEQLQCIFVSREGKNGKQFLKFWVDNYAPGGSESWRVSDKLVHVAPRGYNQKCFQYIAMKKFSHHTWNPKTISIEEWTKLPKG